VRYPPIVVQHALGEVFFRAITSWPLRQIARIQALALAEIKVLGLKTSVLAPSSEALVALPTYQNDRASAETPIPTKYPALRLASFPKAVVTTNFRFPSVYWRRNCVIADRHESGPFRIHPGRLAVRTGGIVGYENDTVYVRTRPVRKVPGPGLYVGTRATQNWSHWLLNFLPSVYLANSSPLIPRDIPLLVPKTALQNVGHREVLELFLEDRPVFALEEGVFYQFDNLLWPDAPVYDAPLSSDSESRKPLRMHRDVMEGFVGQIRARKTPTAGDGTHRRVFIERSGTLHRKFDFPELQSILDKWGFLAVKMEDLGLQQKIDVLANATHVVAASGSGLANLLFATKGVAVLAFTNFRAPSYDNFVPIVAKLVGARLTLESLRPEIKIDGGDDFQIDPAEFEDALHRFLRLNQDRTGPGEI